MFKESNTNFFIAYLTLNKLKKKSLIRNNE